MRFLLVLASFLWIGLAQAQPVTQPPGDPIRCINSIVYDASTSGSTELVPLVTGRTIYVCGYVINSGGTVNVQLSYGTGTACVTGETKLTPAYNLTVGLRIQDPSPFHRGMTTPVSNALCLKTSAGVAVQAIVYYSQF